MHTTQYCGTLVHACTSTSNGTLHVVQNLWSHIIQSHASQLCLTPIITTNCHATCTCICIWRVVRRHSPSLGRPHPLATPPLTDISLDVRYFKVGGRYPHPKPLPLVHHDGELEPVLLKIADGDLWTLQVDNDIIIGSVEDTQAKGQSSVSTQSAHNILYVHVNKLLHFIHWPIPRFQNKTFTDFQHGKVKCDSYNT